MGIGQTSAARAQPEFVLLDFARPPRPAVTTGHKCDRCGSQFSPELSVVWVRVPDTLVEAEMRLCLPCIKSYLDEKALVTALQHQVAQLQKAVVPRAQLLGAEALIEKAVTDAIDRAGILNISARDRAIARERFPATLEAAISRQCAPILYAAKVNLAIEKDKRRINAAIEKEKQRRKDARKKLADELRASRKKLRSLFWATQHAEEEAARQVEGYAKEMRKTLAARLASARARLIALRAAHGSYSREWAKPTIQEYYPGDFYPVVPPSGSFVPHADGLGLPDASGIYFLWAEGIVEYVGRSNKLCGRLRLGQHHVLRANHQISFVFLPMRDLSWAECWYIGLLRPRLNFGSMASHYETPCGDAK